MDRVLTVLFIITFFLVNPNHAQTAGLAKEVVDEAKDYLVKYGYLDTFSIDNEGLKASLQRLQYFANLETTGRLDAATLKQMTIPRCGLRDPKIQIRTRRYVHQGTKWRKLKLTWRLEGRGRTLGRETVRRVMHKAFKFWSDVTNLDFTETSSQEPDIWVKFVTYYHGDPYPFDGEGGTLAHAFYPHNNVGLSGDVHFDDAEDYTIESPRGRNILWVATHEIGHSIGLEHSNVQEAVMYPWYTKYKPGFGLNYDDIIGIQSLYGSRVKATPPNTTPSTTTTTTTTTTTKPTTTTTTTTKPPTTTTTTTQPPTTTTSTTTTPTTTTTTKKATTKPTPYSRPCPPNTITAIYYNTYARLNVIITSNGKLYFVKRVGGIRYGPVKATNYIPKVRVPENIDAAFETNKINGRQYNVFFAGTNYYLYQHFRFVSGPHSIHGNVLSTTNPLNLKFPTWVRKIDAAMTWHQNGRTYFFYNIYYWRYDNDNKRFDAGYPRVTQSGFGGLPKRIDAAYSSALDKKTFFISEDRYYLLNDRYGRVKTGYPEHIGREWLRCGAASPIKIASDVRVDSLTLRDQKFREP